MGRVGLRRFLTIGLVTLTALAACLAPAVAQTADETVRPGAGLYLKPPDGWTVLSQGAADPKKKDDPGPHPLIVLGKYPASHPGFNPKIRVFYQAIPADSLQLTPRGLIQLVLPKTQATFSGMQLEDEVRELTISGLPAAEASWLYTLPAKSGLPLPLRARVVLVRQGDHFFTIGMSAPREGPDDVRPEFQTFLDRMLIGQAPH
ncbi:MAG TPA: hypothetical protein VFE33_22115 [Thermoanaerobaculia bacterium]|nr:hypothetical protein [Thermoanaerobaculia bacterium]